MVIKRYIKLDIEWSAVFNIKIVGPLPHNLSIFAKFRQGGGIKQGLRDKTDWLLF